MITKQPKPIIKTNSDIPEAAELIASSIIKLSEACEELRKSSLNEKAIIILLKDATGVSQRDIKAILFALPNLKRWYTK